MNQQAYPLISVIVPVYNERIEYLELCIYSLQKQTYPNLEFIIIDDGSKQSVADYLDKKSIEDKRIHLIHQKNGGQASARNMGLAVAKGEFVSFVDSDDICKPEMLMKGYAELIRVNADVIGWTYERINGNNILKAEYNGPDYQIYEGKDMWKFCCMSLCSRFFSDIYFPFCVCVWGKLYRTKLFLENPDIRFHKEAFLSEDQDLVQRLFMKVKRFVLLHKDMYLYRINNNSLTCRFRENYVNVQMKAFDILEKSINDSNKAIVYAFNIYRAGFLVNVGTSYLYHTDCKLNYWKKRKIIISVRKHRHCADSIKYIQSKYFTKGQYFYLKCLQWKLYDIALLAAWYGAYRKRKFL